MFERFSRSWSLIKASAEVLRQDKELLVFPFCSAIAALLVAASFLVPLFATGAFEHMGDRGEGMSPAMMITAFAFYLVQYFVIFFFNTALVGAAMIRLRGGDPTVADGFRIAFSKVVPILGYAAIAATVGLILRMIEERAGFIGKWIAGLLGVAFTVATFLTVPVLVNREIGPIEAVKESAMLLKKTWGENIIGNGGIGLVFGLIAVAFALLAVGVMIPVVMTKSIVLIATVGALLGLGFIVLILIQAALQGVYAAALYQYATEGQAGGAFAGPMLSNAFRAKK